MEKDGTNILYFPITNFQAGNFDELYKIITHPNSVQGIADGGAHLGMICDASAPTHLLTHWTRDRKDGPTRAARLGSQGTHQRDRGGGRPQ